MPNNANIARHVRPQLRPRDPVTILDACRDPHLFAPWFKRRETWAGWFSFLAALFGLKMTPAERKLFTQHTGRTQPPRTQAREAWLVVGRRGGKSFIVGLVAVFLACFRDYRKHLAKGERGVLMCLAADRKQARVIFRYVRGLLHGIPMLARLIRAESTESIELTNGIDIEIHTASYRSVRGYTVVAFVGDEVAVWRSEDSANPDSEILAAVLPAMATIPGALLIGISSPYARRGILWERYRDHYGHSGDVLVWQADSRSMNPTLSEAIVARAYKDDPVAAAAEYGAQFRQDVSGFLLSEWIDAAVDENVIERPPLPGTRYVAFCDPSGGAVDAFTMGIAHHDGKAAVLDVLRGRTPPFAPAEVVEDYAKLLRAYGCHRVVGDRYGGAWVGEAFSKHQTIYEPAPKPKSEIYLECEPLFAQGSARLLDQRRLLSELRQLERHTAGAGKDRVDHPPRAHDDHANSACGALYLAKARVPIDVAGGSVWDTPEDRAEVVAERVRGYERDAGRSGPWFD
jgi:hypothetical protein